MGRPQKSHCFRKSLRLESLERREVFAGDMLTIAWPGIQPDQTANPMDPLDGYVLGKSYEYLQPTDKLAAGLNQTEFDAKLKELVGQYWQGVFGKKPIELPTVYSGPVMYDRLVMDNQLLVIRADMVQTTGFASFDASAGTRSITNTRHISIDEGDSSEMTSDGYLYTTNGNTLYVANLRDPANISAAALIGFEGYNAQLLVSGDTLIAVQSLYSGYSPGLYGYPYHNQQTRISLYDISDRMAPRSVSTTMIDGSNSAVRLVDGQLTLVQTSQNALPKPVLVSDSSGVERYELLDSYYATNYAAIVAALQPNYGQSATDEAPAATIDSGTWDDLSFAGDSLVRSTSILRYGLDGSNLTLLDSETIAGLTPNLIYQGLEDVYLVAWGGNWGGPDSSTLIYKIDATGVGQLKTLGVATVKGHVSDASWLNEHNGVLQVASSGWVAEPPPVDPTGAIRIIEDPIPSQPIIVPWWSIRGHETANITTLGETDAGWKVLGTLEDIGDGQGLLAASFVGDRAMITTGSPQTFDPLHGIDLSDPANPVELSELTIPGFTTYLQQIDETHWLGFGFDQNVEARATHLQVSLYEGADLSNPTLLDRWMLLNNGSGRTWNPQSISFDPATGLLVLSNVQDWQLNGSSALPVLKVDVTAEDPLRELGKVSLNHYINRSFTLENVLVTITPNGITTYDVADLSKPLDEAPVSNYQMLNYLFWGVPIGGSRDVPMAEQWNGEPFEITGIETTGDITATIKPDKTTVTLTAAANLRPVEQSAKLTLRFSSGYVHTVYARFYAYENYVPPVDEPVYADSSASIGAQFTDDAGNVVTELSAGDEVWVTVSLTETRDNAAGVFGGYVDVAFDSRNVTVIGQLEYTDFVNGKLGTISSGGIQSFGGFGSHLLPSTSTSQIGRFKIRVEDDLPVAINITPSTKRNEELLVYQLNKPVNPARVTPFALTTQTDILRGMLTADNRRQDVNSDGMITAMDVLQVVNYINSRSATAAESTVNVMTVQSAASNFDISGDGVVSGMDVLQIVNTINSRYTAQASGEGSSLSAPAVDQVLAVDLDFVAKRR